MSDIPEPTISGEIHGSDPHVADTPLLLDKVGVDPTLPIGPGNPPAGGGAPHFEPGKSGNPKGKPPGTRNSKTIMREMLNAMRSPDAKRRPALAVLLGRDDVAQVSQRELILGGQVEKAIDKQDTAAARYCAEVAGDVGEAGNLPSGLPPIILQLNPIKPGDPLPPDDEDDA